MGLGSIFPPKGKISHKAQDNSLPGTILPLEITIIPEEDLQPRQLRAELIGQETYYVHEMRRDSKGHVHQHTAARENTFASIVQTVAEQPAFSKGLEQKWTCSLQLPPDAPPTTRGQLVNIRWTLKAVLDVPKRADMSQERPHFVLCSPPQASEATVTPTEAVLTEVTLSLKAPRVAVAGNILKGQLALQIKEKFNFRSIRVELVRVEEAGVSKYNEVVSKSQVSGKTACNPNESLPFDFALEIPAGAQPTVDYGYSHLRWKVRAVIDREMKSDFNVEQGVTVYNPSKPLA
jgi:hypothetical protein